MVMLIAVSHYFCYIKKISMSQLNKKMDEIIAAWSSFINNGVFYIPVLGPVYTSGKSIKKLLFDVLKNSETDKFLSYDKNKRWLQKRGEKIILSSIVYNNKEMYLPVKDGFRNILKIFRYSNDSPDNITIATAKKICRKLKTTQEINGARFYFFKEPKINMDFVCHNIYFKKISSNDNFLELPKEINNYNRLSNKIRLTFSRLEKEPGLESFSFLWKEFLNKNKVVNPIFCAVSKNKIIGAIGPIDVLKDVRGKLFLLPPYFGVIKKMRERGIGEKLWKTAMKSACKIGAQYVLVQNIPDSSADWFYKKQGLSVAGKIYSCSLI